MSTNETNAGGEIQAIGENTVIREPGKSSSYQALKDRAGALLEKLAGGDVGEGDSDGGEPAGEEDGANPAPTEPETPKAKRPSKLDELDAKRTTERARLKKRTAEELAKREADAEREGWRQERAQMQALIAELQGKSAALDPKNPEVLRRVLAELGGDAVGQFILDDIREANNGGAPRQASPTPSTGTADPRDAKIEQLQQQLNDFIGAQQRAANETNFKAKVAALTHDEDGGAPLTGALLKKDPTRVINMAYAVAQEFIRAKKVFDDDDIIEKIETELSSFRDIFGTPKQAAALVERATTENAVEEADEPAEEPKARSTPRRKLSNKEALLQRMAQAKRIVASIDRQNR